MPARIEPFAGVVRFWDNEEAQHGDPYQWAASVRWVDNETIEIAGITQPPTQAIWRAVKDAAREFGAKQIVFIRYKDGQPRIRTVTLKPKDK